MWKIVHGCCTAISNIALDSMSRLDCAGSDLSGKFFGNIDLESPGSCIVVSFIIFTATTMAYGWGP